MNTIKLGIIDDDALIVNLLKNFLDSEDGIEVVMTASDGADCINQLTHLSELPAVLIMDLKMEGMNGITATEELRKSFPTIKIIIISSHYKVSFMGFMLKTGVSAFAPKGISTTELVQIITEVHQKGYFFDTEQLETIREQLSSKFPKPVLDDRDILSERERDVLKLICQQKTAKEIGDKLFITKRTVEGHKNNLFIKTGAKNVAGLVIYAIQNKIINSEDLPVL